MERLLIRQLPHKGRMALYSVLAMAMTIIVASTVVLFMTSLFVVQSVHVSGIEILTEKQILDTAQIPLGTRLAQLDTRKAAVKVAQLPRVKRVRVAVDYPNKATIKVQERIGVAFFRAQGLFFEVAADGVVMKSRKKPVGVPEIVVPRPDKPSLQREAAVKVAQRLPSDIKEVVQTIKVDSAAMVVLHLHDGRRIEMGSPTRLEDKIITLRLVLTQDGSVWNIANPEIPTRR